MITATARTPVTDQATTAAAQEAVKAFDADVMGGAEEAGPTTVPASVESAGGMEVTRSAASVPAKVSPYADDSMVGDWDQSDVQFPVLTIVQGSSGALVERGYPTGTLVLGEDELFPPPRPKEPPQVLRFVPMKVEKSYRENVSSEEYNSGVMPRFAKTKEEVLALGGSLAWGPNGEKPTWGASARCVFLIEAPKDTEHPAFGIELDGKTYAVGVHYAKGAGYKTTAMTLFNCFHTVLFVNKLDAEGKPMVVPGSTRFQKEKLLWKRFWNWSWGTVKSGNFNPWRARVVLTPEDTSPAVREFVSGLVAPHEAMSADE